LSSIAARCGMLDGALRSAVAAYRSAETIAGDVHSVADALRRLPSASGQALAVWNQGGTSKLDQLGPAWTRLFAQDPALVDLAMDGGLVGLDSLAAPAMADGHAAVTDAGDDPRRSARATPTGITDLMIGLRIRNQGAPGEIDV